MAELEVEALKRYISKPERTYADELWLEEQLNAIIVALDDGKLHRFLLDKALEERERLRAAALAVYVDEAGFCHGIGRLRAALEGRDG